jgi:hypothetical protein
MPSPIHNTGNSSSHQTDPSESSLEKQLFESVALSVLPAYSGLDDLPNATICLIENIKSHFSLQSDLANAVVNNAGSGAVVEFEATSLAAVNQTSCNQLNAVLDLLEMQDLQFKTLNAENERLKNQLFSIERNLNHVTSAATRYYLRVQELSCELGIDADLGVNLDVEITTDSVLDSVINKNKRV